MYASMRNAIVAHCDSWPSTPKMSCLSAPEMVFFCFFEICGGGGGGGGT